MSIVDTSHWLYKQKDCTYARTPKIDIAACSTSVGIQVEVIPEHYSAHCKGLWLSITYGQGNHHIDMFNNVRVHGCLLKWHVIAPTADWQQHCSLGTTGAAYDGYVQGPDSVISRAITYKHTSVPIL